jgi:hypothetical protein
MAEAGILAAVLEIVRLHNPVIWYRRWRAAKAVAEGRVILDHNAHYGVDDKGERIAGPWCTTCYDAVGEKVRFIPAPQPPGHTGPSWAYVQCPRCKNVFASREIGEYLKTH